MKNFISILLFVMLLGLSYESRGQNKTNNEPGDKLTYEVIASPNNTWGYDIYRNGKLFVHQPNVPGQVGNEGFKTKSATEAVAKEVISKIKRGEMPPTITIDELKKLNAI
jgi:hypothetical protein